jgi:hypothetical protein
VSAAAKAAAFASSAVPNAAAAEAEILPQQTLLRRSHHDRNPSIAS